MISTQASIEGAVRYVNNNLVKLAKKKGGWTFGMFLSKEEIKDPFQYIQKQKFWKDFHMLEKYKDIKELREKWNRKMKQTRLYT